MLRASSFMRCAALGVGVGGRKRLALDSATLLDTVRRDPQRTAAFYSENYFGEGTEPRISHLLWTELKKRGFVAVEGRDSTDKPLWVPCAFNPPLAPTVRTRKAFGSEGSSQRRRTKRLPWRPTGDDDAGATHVALNSLYADELTAKRIKFSVSVPRLPSGSDT